MTPNTDDTESPSIVVDMGTARMTVRDLIAALRTAPPDTPVYIGTGGVATKPLVKVVGARVSNTAAPSGGPTVVVLT